MTVKFHPAARTELLEARLWYEKRSPLAAVAFAQEVNAVISRIAKAPMQCPLAEHEPDGPPFSGFPITCSIGLALRK